MKTASSIQDISRLKKVQYLLKLLKMKLARGHHPVGAWDEFNEYQAILGRFDDHEESKLVKHKVLEIGYGARPWRLLTLASLGVDVVGIDLDQPTYGFNVTKLLQVLHKNGFERFAKSFVRSLLFDLRDLRRLERELLQSGKSLVPCDARLHVGNAAEPHHFKPNSFSFVYSEDVFEHIPSSTLPAVVENMYHWMRPHAIALIRPNIFTGITGGHDPDYYSHKVQLKESDPNRAWAHLWDPQFAVDTYLNKMRLPDYVVLFKRHFEILEVKQKYDQLGIEYLARIRNRLPDTYSDDELLTNQIAIILRSKKERS